MKNSVPRTEGKCLQCRESRPVDKDGICWGCEIINRLPETPDTICVKCRDKVATLEGGLCMTCGWEYAAERAAIKARQENLKKLFGEQAATEFMLENFKKIPGTESALAAATLFNPHYNSLFLYGPTGRGKTHLAFGIAMRQYLDGRNVDWSTPSLLVPRFKAQGQKYVEQMNYFTALDVLLIDEIGLRSASDAFLEVFCEILNRRHYAGKRGLIVTSNLYLSDLEKLNQEDRLTSRLAQECEGGFYEINTKEDYRTEGR